MRNKIIEAKKPRNHRIDHRQPFKRLQVMEKFARISLFPEYVAHDFPVQGEPVAAVCQAGRVEGHFPSEIKEEEQRQYSDSG